MNDLQYRKLFSDIPVIKTARLLLRKLTQDDLYDVNEYAADENLSRYLRWTPHLNLHETKGYIEFMQKRYRKGLHAEWGVTLADTGKVIGTCGFSGVDLPNESCELGYVLSSAYRGQGYMSEAFQAVLKIAFCDLQAHRVTLQILQGNDDSVRFAMRNGFRHEGTLQNALYVKGEYRTVLLYAMLREEYDLHSLNK